MILHITNDYSGSTVYMNLIKELDNLGVKQIIYTPIKSETSIDKNKIELTVEGSKIIYSNILNLTWDRLFYRNKIKKILRDIEHKVDLAQISIVHSHTWYSDGGVAYLLNKKYNIPYITAVRSTDLSTFYKLLIHERRFGKAILHNSRKIIFINNILKQRVLDIYPSLKDKYDTIANGVDKFWIDNSSSKDLSLINKSNIKILYIGTFIRRKKLDLLQDAIIEINNNSTNFVLLDIVGGGGSIAEKVITNVEQFPEYFNYYGKISNKDKLLAILRTSDIFAMPSINETFGLVYIEAMLQGLPILYTKDEGIDGFYKDSIGEKVNKSAGVKEIKEKLELMISKIDSYKIPTGLIKENHDWRLIALEYRKIYKAIINI